LLSDFGAEISVWADFALSRWGQVIRRETGMPRPVMMLMTLEGTVKSLEVEDAMAKGKRVDPTLH
jgi:hypothetical protein